MRLKTIFLLAFLAIVACEIGVHHEDISRFQQGVIEAIHKTTITAE